MANSSRQRGAIALCGAIGLVVLVAGCAQVPSQKGPVAATPLEPVARVRTPDGWVQERNATHQLVASRDGYLVQFVFVAARINSDAFPAIKKGADQSILPSQLAELHIANLKASAGERIEVVENEPAEVGDLSGYRLQLRFFDGRGLEFKAFVYAAADDRYFYRLAYQAPVLYFFDRDLPAFETMVKTFQRGVPPADESGWAIVSLDVIPVQKKN